MNRRAIGTALLSAGLATWTTAQGEEPWYYMDGQLLYEELSQTSPEAKNFAYGYLAGVSDVIQVEGLHCSPKSLKTSTLGDVVHKDLSTIPEYRTQPAMYLVSLALILHWPCTKDE